VRITCSEIAGVVLDGPSVGRGAWLCRDGEVVDATCLDRAIRSRAFERAWRRTVDADLQQAVRTAVEQWRATGPAADSGSR
jgi:predicted RNA-binding protein YlxR (DUF448 family)